MQTTPLNGITTAPPNTLCADGDTHLLVNLRKKDGVLQPVTPGKQIGTLKAEYNYIYLHQLNGSVNWLGVIGNTLFTDLLTTPKQIAKLTAPVTRLHHIGNTLIAVTPEGLNYFLYHNNAYKNLGTKPPFPYFSFYTRTTTASTPFSELTAVPDIQTAMEALIIKNRWKPDNAFKLSGTFLICYALRLFDGSYVRHSAPLLVGAYRTHPYYAYLAYSGDDFIQEHSTAYTSLFQITCTISTSILKEWSDIITSVDIFISPELNTLTDTFKPIEESITNTIPPSDHIRYTRKVINPQDIDTDKLLADIADAGNFYLIRSIPIADTATEVTFPEKSDFATLQNLIYNEQLPGDTFTHHNISAAYTCIYNSRLHLADIQTVFFPGFGLPAFTAQTYSTSIRPTTRRPVNPPPDNVPVSYIETYIKIQGQPDGCVVASVYNTDYYHINPLFSYPDARAYKSIIYFCDTNNQVYKKIEIPLKPHNALNIAYYITPGLDYLELQDTIPFRYTPPPGYATVTENNKIKVSALNNPFQFPNQNTYTVAGRVLAMASNAVPVSDGQFGQFPLYLFTESGINVMQIGGSGEVIYSNIIPVADEIALPGTITPVSGAIFFLTVRGAYLIAGSKAQPISEALNAPQPQLHIQNFKPILLHLFPGFPVADLSFLTFIASGVAVHFNYPQNEILIVSQQQGYAYVYNLNAAQWHITTHTFAPVQNTYPYLYGIVGRTVIDIADETPGGTPVLLLTRALKLGSCQYKNLHRYIIRALIHNSADCGLFTCSSNDAIHFCIKSNLRIPPGQHIDPDTGLIARNTYRYFLALLVGNMDKESRINYIDTTAYPTYNNDKIR